MLFSSAIRLLIGLTSVWMLILTSGASWSQNSTTDSPFIIRVNRMDIVSYPRIMAEVAVTTLDGSPVCGLSSREFHLSEEGQEAKIDTLIQQRQDALAIVIAIDCSGSMRGSSLAAVRSAITDFLHRLAPNDRYALITFNSEVAPEKLLFTKKASDVNHRIQSLKASGATRLYDGVATAISALQKQDAKRRVLLLFSDGCDTQSHTSLQTVIRQINESKIEIYAITFGSHVERRTLEQLVSASGGILIDSPKTPDLLKVFQRMLGAINTRYQLTYTSPQSSLPGVLRQTQIRVKMGKHSASAEGAYVVPTGSVDGDTIYNVGPGLVLAGLVFLNVVLGVCLWQRRQAGFACHNPRRSGP